MKGSLFLFLVYRVSAGNRVEFLDADFSSSKGLSVLERVVGMAFADAFCVAFRYQFYKSVL